MPLINMPVDLLLELVNADREVLTEAAVSDTLHDMGVEVEELTATTVYVCRACDNVIEQTKAQGAPLHCAKCGTDFRERTDLLKELGQNKVARLDMLAVRPDIFDPGGMARYMRGFLGVRTGLIEYEIREPKLTLRVDPKLSRPESYRPHIACAVLRNMVLDDDRIKLLMNLQEDLHWSLGRDRKLASIGVYDLATLSDDEQPYLFEAVAPDGLRFVPLGFSPDDAGANMTPGEILEKHKTGQKYAHLLAGFSAFPLLRDGRGAVLSMPPIINSEATRCTRETTQCFVDVTGLSNRTVERSLNVLVTGLMEVMPELVVEAVRIVGPDEERITPDLTPAPMTLGVQEACDTIGIPLEADQLASLLERMGHGVAKSPDGVLQVRVPAWRNDVMHPVDLIEDAAIAYGYENLKPELVPTFTVGAPREIEERSAAARRVLTGLGFHQVMTLPLSSENAAFEKWRIEPDPRAVKIENPISVEQTICRVSLLPGLLETLAINKQYDLPQYLFEVGDCCFVDSDEETGAREARQVAAAMIGTRVGFADIRAVADAFVREMDLASTIAATEHPGFIAGRVAKLVDANGERLGVLGEVHPIVLENYGLKHPVSVLELSL